MLPVQLLSVLHYPCCMRRTRPSQGTRRTGHPQLWWLLQFEGRATRAMSSFELRDPWLLFTDRIGEETRDPLPQPFVCLTLFLPRP